MEKLGRAQTEGQALSLLCEVLAVSSPDTGVQAPTSEVTRSTACDDEALGEASSAWPVQPILDLGTSCSSPLRRASEGASGTRVQQTSSAIVQQVFRSKNKCHSRSTSCDRQDPRGASAHHSEWYEEVSSDVPEDGARPPQAGIGGAAPCQGEAVRFLSASLLGALIQVAGTSASGVGSPQELPNECRAVSNAASLSPSASNAASQCASVGDAASPVSSCEGSAPPVLPGASVEIGFGEENPSKRRRCGISGEPELSGFNSHVARIDS